MREAGKGSRLLGNGYRNGAERLDIVHQLGLREIVRGRLLTTLISRSDLGDRCHLV